MTLKELEKAAEQGDAKAQYEMQSLTPEEQEELENANTGQEAQ